MCSRSTNANYSEVLKAVRSLPKNQSVVDRFHRHSLNVGFVKWEDTARTKGSVWGPNISDVTLDVEDESFPIIGTQNFRDPTFDWPIERFSVNVGNEKEDGTTLTRISLKEYLENIGSYIDSEVVGSMFLERDSHILTSAQCCILPL